MGEVERKRKVIKTLLRIHHSISQSREGSCVLFILRKYLCKHLEVSIFLCSLGAEEGRDPPLEKKQKDWRIKFCSLCSQGKYCQPRQGWAEGGQDFLLSPSEQQFPSALSFNFKVEFVLY